MKGTVFEQVLGPKSAPEAFAGEPSFSMLCLRQLSSQAVLAEHASSPALGLSTFRSRVKSAAHILFIAISSSFLESQNLAQVEKYRPPVLRKMQLDNPRFS